MATMTFQDLLNLQNQNPGASREQLAAIWQHQGGVTVPTPTPPPPGTPPAVSGGSVNPTPTPSPTTGGGGGGGGGGATPSASLASAIASYQASHPYTAGAFQDLVKTLQSQGYHISIATHAGNTPSEDAIVDPQGNVYDLVNSAGDPGAHWQNISQGGYDPSRSVVGPDGNIINYADWSKAYGGTGSSVFNPNAPGGGGGAAAGNWGDVGQMLSNLGYAPGSVFAPWTQTWQTPTADQALNYPGVQFAMNNAMRLMQNSAAAQGVLGNARAQEAISQNLGQDLLGQYQSIRGMALGDYLQNQQDFFANQDRPWQKFYQGTSLGIQANQL